MIRFSHSKINLGLYITDKREDGYHNLESLFLPIEYSDVVELIPAKETELFLYGRRIPGDRSKNSCLLTLELMREKYGIGHYQIHLYKHIPTGAGLGGGSANSAAVVRILNDSEHLELSVEEQESVALQIGSDNPFFIESKAKFVSGRGEQLQDCAMELSGYKVVLIIPLVHQSTKEAYQNVQFLQPNIDLKTLTKEQLILSEVEVQNSFQDAFIQSFPQTMAILNQLKAAGAIYASLSGSGSAFYGLFNPNQTIGPSLQLFADKAGYTYIETKII